MSEPFDAERATEDLHGQCGHRYVHAGGACRECSADALTAAYAAGLRDAKAIADIEVSACASHERAMIYTTAAKMHRAAGNVARAISDRIAAKLKEVGHG